MALFSKGLIFLALLASLFPQVYSESEKCSVDIDLYWFDEHRNPARYNEDYVGVLEKINTTNVKDAKFSSTKYLEAKVEDGVLIISSTKEILKYELDEKATGRIEDQLNILCKNDSENFKFTYIQDIIDINTHDPKFEKDEYVFVFNSPLKRSFELHDVMQVFASDKDFSTTYLTFEVGLYQDIYVQRKYDSEGKKQEAQISLRDDIEPNYNKSFIISVKDNGQPPRSSTTKLTLIVNPQPTENNFTELKYNAEIKNMSLNYNFENLTLANGFDDTTEIKIESDYAEYFEAKKNYLKNRIDISVVKEIPIPRKANPSIKLKVVAIDKGLNSSTDFTIKSDKPIAYLCKFNQRDLYEWKGPYQSPIKIIDTHEGFVEEIATANVLGLSCESKYLRCDFQNQTLKIFTTEEFKKFEENEVSTSIKMKIELQCHYEKHTLDYKHTIIDINNHAPEFSAKSYSYIFYNEFYNLDLQEVSPLFIYDMDVTTYSFDLSIEENNEIWFWDAYITNKTAYPSLDIRSKISPPFKKKYILRASDGGNPRLTGEAVLYLEAREGHNFTFTKPSYFAYVEKNRLIFPYDNLELENGFDEKLDLFLRADYWDYFLIDADMLRNSINIFTKGNLTDIPKSVVSLTIEARWQGLFARTVVYVHLIEFDPTKPTESGEETTSIKPETPNPIFNTNPLNGYNNWIFYSTLSQITIFIVAVIYFGLMIVIIRRTSLVSTFFKVSEKEIIVTKVEYSKDLKKIPSPC